MSKENHKPGPKATRARARADDGRDQAAQADAVRPEDAHTQDAQAESAQADPLLAARRRLLEAALPLVPFDGWSEAALSAAAEEAGVDRHLAKLAFPRGGLDMALFFHREGDREMTARLTPEALAPLRVRERVAFAVRARLELVARRRETVRKAAALFALPLHAAEGARAVWETADAIWTALGDPSEDLNWYTKRAILSGVISSSTLYWLGDESPDSERTWAFLDRRIEDVMRFEKFKSAVNANPLGRMVMAGPNWLASRIRRPGGGASEAPDLPG